MTTPSAVPLETPFSRVDDLAEAVRAGKPLPRVESSVLQHYANMARSAGARDAIAEIVVAAELVDQGFQMHRLSGDAGCRRDELLLGDYSLVCAAELATRLGRSDVDREFARAAMNAAAGEDYVPRLESAVATALRVPLDGKTPAASTNLLSVSNGEELAAIDAYLMTLVAGDPALVGEPMAKLLGAGGKRLRSVLAFLASTLGPHHDPESAAILASVVEFIHNATLVHDDLVDESPLRRGLPAVHVAYAPAVAVRVGDFYFGRAADLLGSLDNHRATRLVVEAVALVCQAQIEEFMQRGQDHLDEAGYLSIVEGKTAALFAGACAAGAAVGGASEAVVEAMQGYGRNLGVAFQMVDDVLDFSSTSGKALAQDLRQKVTSLPLVYAEEDPAVSVQLAALRGGDSFDGEAAVALVTEVGALDRAMARARQFRDEAVGSLEGLAASETRDRLVAYAEFAIERHS
jgi:octaprenyl-diphosphate synthase